MTREHESHPAWITPELAECLEELHDRLESRKPEEGALFPEVLTEYMAECGIDNLEELHRRYVEAGGELRLKRFKNHLSGEDEYIYRSLIPPLSRALGIEHDVDSRVVLAVAYGLGYAPPPYNY